MADPTQAPFWEEVGKALAYILSGAGTIWGAIWGVKKMKGDSNNLFPNNQQAEDIKDLSKEVGLLKQQVSQNATFINAYTRSLEKAEKMAERIHKRIDEIAERMARMEGRMERD